jgi:hypothetical protein
VADGFHCAKSSERPQERGLGLRHVDRSGRRAQERFGAFGRLSRALDIDLMRHFSCFSHYRHMIVLNFDKSTGHSEMLDLISHMQTNFPGLKLGHKRRVLRKDAQLPICRRDDDRVRLRVQDISFGSQDINRYCCHFN